MRIALVLLVALSLTGCGAGATTDVTAADDAQSSEPPTWQRVADPPIAPREGAAIAWTGEEILVFGGSTFLCPPNAHCLPPKDPPFKDGAAYEPVAGTWRTIADAPMPVGHATTATLNGDVYALATPRTSEAPDPRTTTLLRYRPRIDEWSSYPVPLGVPLGGLTATDAAIVVYADSDESGPVPDLLFNPAEDSWTELPADPLSPAFDRRYAWDGDALHLFARDITPSPGGASGPSLVTAARLDGNDWTELPTGETLGFWSVIVDGDRIVSPELGCADGGEVNGYGRCIPFGAVFNTTTGTWAELPNAPRRGAKDVASSGAITAENVLLSSVGHPMLDLRTNTWFEMPRIDQQTTSGTTVQRTLAGAGPYGFAFGGSRFGPADPGGTLLGDAWLWSLRSASQ